MKVYEKIAQVQSEIAAEGIAKSKTNHQGAGYKFRGIDDIYNASSSLMAKVGLCMLPRILSRTVTERASKSGGTMFVVVVDAEYDFVAVEDGSKHTVKTFGEAMDSGDKATNKAMSAAHKYALIQAFSIPVEGDNDTENQSPETFGMSINVLADHLTAINDVANAEDLQKVFGVAYKAANGDKGAQKRLIAAKDQRKTALGVA
ncbi:Essential recombination function protein [uncultured Caudovirales phage]|uniref:Essential recombination function protein n=1 Tax=uncultured Caudovirales phage TaxID=2100421 RepID=A0A6J5LGU8_9CAUD|nr:Essential recombination function protein [uncultured Caudovirales phage]